MNIFLSYFMQVFEKLGYMEFFAFIANSKKPISGFLKQKIFFTDIWFRTLKTELACFLFFISLLHISCGNNQMNEPSNTLTYNESQGLSTLDPALAGVSAPIQIGGQIFSGLLDLDSDHVIQPCLAKSWQVDSSGKEWIFTLKPNICFHRDTCFGNTSIRRFVKAQDVKYSFERICDARVKTSGFWIFRNRLLGADEFNEATKAGISPKEGIKGIIVLNDSMVKIILKKPFAPFLSLLTMSYCQIVPKEAIEYYGQSFGIHPIGTGPFMVKSWKSDQQLVLARNPDYFRYDINGNRLPYLDSIIIRFIKDTKTEFLEYEQGKLDIVLSLDPVFMSKVIGENDSLLPTYANHHLIREESEDIVYCGIMLDSAANAETSTYPLWKSKLLRQALNYAIDRKAICKYILKGKGVPAEHGPLSPSMPGFSREVKGYTYNPQKARLLLAEAGYPDGNNLPTIIMQSGNNATTIQTAEALQQQWQKLGIKVSLRQVNFAEHSSMMHSGKLGFWRGNWITDYPDPENVLALFYSPLASPKGLNDTRIHSRIMDSLYEQALWPGHSVPKRYAMYNEMERIVIEEAPWVFLYYTVNYRLAQPSVIGLRPEVFGRLLFENVRIKRAN